MRELGGFYYLDYQQSFFGWSSFIEIKGLYYQSTQPRVTVAVGIYKGGGA